MSATTARQSTGWRYQWVKRWNGVGGHGRCDLGQLFVFLWWSWRILWYSSDR